MPRHPNADLFRTGCSHAFTFADSIRSPEQYAASFFAEDHRRWFEHPGVALFERILLAIPGGASVLGRGDLLRLARTRLPNGL
jgi:hypothetical protein